MQSQDDVGTLGSSIWLKRLRELADARLGFDVRTNRPAPLGPMVVAVKKAFRVTSQPFINELLEKQATFNREVADWAHALTRDIEAVERSMLSMRTGLEIRLTRLEARLTKLEELQRQSSPAADAERGPPRARGES